MRHISMLVSLLGPTSICLCQEGVQQPQSALSESVQEEHGLPGKVPGTERWIVLFKTRSFDLEAFREANARNAPPADIKPLVAALDASVRADQAPFAAWLAALGGSVTAQWWIINGCAVEVPPLALGAIRGHANVLRVEPDRLWEPARAVRSPAPILTATNAANHNADAVQAAGTRGQGVNIAVMDTGQDSASAALGRPHATYYQDGNLAINSGGIGGSRLLANKQFGSQVADDVHGHGTGVAGIAAGGKWNANANSDHGHAPHASIVGYAISDNLAGSASTTTMVNAWNAIAADKGAYFTVAANNSYSGSPSPLDPVQMALDSAAYNANIFVAVAAGNNGASTASSQSCANGLAVAACSATTKAIAGFSSKGPLSGDPTRHYPDITGCGVNTVMPLRNNEGDATGYVASGTSMASPQVCGAGALYRSRKPTASALETKAALLATTEDIAALNPGGTREWYGLGFLRDDSVIAVANGGAAIFNSALTPLSLAKSFCINVSSGKKYTVVLAWHRQNFTTTAWTNMDLTVIQGGAYVSADPRNLYQRIVFTASATGTATILVQAPGLEAGQSAVPFSLVVPGATSCTAARVSPVAYTAAEAPTNNSYPFGFASSFSYQQVHPDLRGVPYTISRLAMRRDGTYGSTTIPARSLTLSLFMGGTTAAAVGTSYLANYSTARTAVISGKTINLPDIGPNVGAPAPIWGALLPLDASYAWNGLSHFVWEARVTAISSTAAYILDATSGTDVGLANGVSYGTACTAAGKSGPHAAAATFTTRSFAGTVGFAFTSTNGPNSQAAAYLIGTQVNMPLSGLCTNVLVNPILAINGVTNAIGTFNPPTLTGTYYPAAAGVHLFGQAAALDPARANPIKLSATNGTDCMIVAAQSSFRLARIYTVGDGGTSGSGAFEPSSGLVVRID